MDSLQFFNAVVLMRQAQCAYFKTRSREALRTSKRYETIVDQEIERVRSILGTDRLPKIDNHPKLFEQ